MDESIKNDKNVRRLSCERLK